MKKESFVTLILLFVLTSITKQEKFCNNVSIDGKSRVELG